MTDKIVYRKGFKYQLDVDYTVKVPIYPDRKIELRFIDLDTDGTLLIRGGYAWDGPSGPTLDTKDTMRASLVHDALYQLIRGKYIEQSKYRTVADQLLHTIGRADGMGRFRAWYFLKSVASRFGDKASTQAGERKLCIAP